MKTARLILGILTLFVMHTLVLSAAAEPSGALRTALKHAGGNRSDMETALREIKGADTEYLIAHASQYDLVNLTAQQIIENVTYARKVHMALPYLGKKIADELWREWVLPQRVLDEDLDLWRKDFYEQMQPLLQGKKTVREVVDAAHAWLMEGTTATSDDGIPPAPRRRDVVAGMEDGSITGSNSCVFDRCHTGRGRCG